MLYSLPYSFIQISSLEFVHENMLTLSFSVAFRITMGDYSFDQLVCGMNVMDISVLNYDDEDITVRDMLATVNDSDHSIIEITSPSLKLNRHYNVTLNVRNSAGSDINMNLSKL